MADSNSPGKLTACNAIKDLVSVLVNSRCQKHPQVIPVQETWAHIHASSQEALGGILLLYRKILRFAS